LEPDPDKPGNKRIKDGVAPECRVSISDGEMRHGRKSKSKRFNGYKRHIAADIDSRLISACAVTPANRSEEEAAPELHADIKRQKLNVTELHIDRGYVSASTVSQVLDAGGDVLCKPWVARNNAALFTKRISTSTCDGSPSRVLLVKRNLSRRGPRWNSTRNAAAAAGCEPSARWRLEDAPWPSRRTNASSTGFGNWLPRPKGDAACASASS
jgi:hypothetical protein